MKLLLLADIHGQLDRLPVIEPSMAVCDGIVIAGDITDFDGPERARFVLEKLSAYEKPIFAVPGNCDLPGVEQALQAHHASIHGSSLSLAGLHFVGVGGSLPCPGATPNEADENDFRKVLDRAVSSLKSTDNLVLVTHQPAWGTQLDMAGADRHTGSRAVREFIEQYQPILAISGHMHEAYGVDQLGKTTLVNPGPFRRGRYGVVEVENQQIQARLYP